VAISKFSKGKVWVGGENVLQAFLTRFGGIGFSLMVLCCSAAWHGVCFVRVLARAGVCARMTHDAAWCHIVSVLMYLLQCMDTLWGI
jgi:hypothetical protein